MTKENVPDCTFCQIVASVRPASVVYADDVVLAFLDIHPVNPGHVLVIPKAHYAALGEVPGPVWAHLAGVAQRIAGAIRASDVRCEGVNLSLADGAAAGQDVFHCHLHIRPRYVGDSFRAHYDALQPTRAELDAVAQRIALEYRRLAGLAPDADVGRRVPVRIRPGKVADVAAVQRLQQRWEDENCTLGYIADSADDLSKRLGRYFQVAESDGRIVGFAAGSVRTSGDDQSAVLPVGTRYVEIDDIYVVPERRSQKIGHLLADALMQTARADGVERFLVYSSTRDHERILAFYRGLGFKAWFTMLYI